MDAGELADAQQAIELVRNYKMLRVPLALPVLNRRRFRTGNASGTQGQRNFMAI